MAWFAKKKTLPLVYMPNATDTTPVAGVSFNQAVLAQLGVGAHDFALVPEPTNPYDANAVGVWVPQGQVGHLPAEISGPFSALLRRGEAQDGNRTQVRGEVRSGDGLWVLLEVPSVDQVKAWLSA